MTGQNDLKITGQNDLKITERTNIIKVYQE
jgi:hypothetical protein